MIFFLRLIALKMIWVLVFRFCLIAGFRSDKNMDILLLSPIPLFQYVFFHVGLMDCGQDG